MNDLTNNLLQRLLNNSFADRGTEILDGTNLSTTKEFTGFIVGDNGVVISSITTDANQVGGDYAAFPYSAGAWYPISGTAMTISSGSVILIK